MEKIVLAASAVVALAFAQPAYSQSVLTCQVIDDYVPVGEKFVVDYEPAYIDGSTPGSRVNVRTGPGSEFEANAYGLVGDAVQVVGQAFSTNCDTWIQVKFPVSGHTGWVHSDFIRLHYGRGWWT
ncbi:MAG: SH3 domain-containing protein [Nodosilinea sp.]